ncbi:MAG: Stf0 family sulfotransferase [Mesorhizobium sp.]|nr:Stf0 family sulfotransferase [Mesorhizobium sp.]
MGLAGIAKYSAYILCATPRSGSTLLCDMLAATGVAGRPHSFFRQEDIPEWADYWGVPQSDLADDPEFDRAYLAAMLRDGTGDTGVFGLRLMWASVADATRRLDRLHPGLPDAPARFEKAFGPTLYVHLSRRDKVAQAVSRIRAEQSGLWHLGADGTERERTAPPRPAAFDADRIAALVAELQADDAAWNDFFAAHRIEPLRLTYETMAADPQPALANILSALGRDPELARTVHPGTAKLANDTSREWADRFRKATDATRE